MAEKRMFAKSIVLSDAFLDMPATSRCLYFTLSMLADDEGFCNSPRGIMRQCGASDDDMKLLIAKKFVLVFDSGVIVIKHWRINNYLNGQRFTETKYTDEREAIYIDKKGSYTTDATQAALQAQPKKARREELPEHMQTGNENIDDAIATAMRFKAKNC